MLRPTTLIGSLAVALAACVDAPAPDQAADREAIAAATTETEAAENAGSVARMRPHFTDDVIMMGPNMPGIAGADAVAQAMQEFFDAFSAEIQYTSEEIVAVDDWGFDRGTYRQTLTPKDGTTPVTENGKYLWVYRKDPNGSWKQSRVIWNSSDPVQQAGS